MSSKLTKEHLTKYLANPDICPFCDSDTLKARGAGFVEAICSRDIECTNCRETFTEEFVMIGMSHNNNFLHVHQDSFLEDVNSINYDGYIHNTK